MSNQSPEYQFAQFKKDYLRNAELLKDTIDLVLSTKDNLIIDVAVRELATSVLSLCAKVSTPLELIDMVHNLRYNSDIFYIHSLSVALISVSLGRWMRWSNNDLYLLMLCGLFHDIGKALIRPEDILLAPRKLTPLEFEIVKTHPELGYHAIKDTNLPDCVKDVVLSHHEKGDGSGYPYHKKANQLSKYVKIISIADVYDALTSNRAYRTRPFSPYEVMERFEKEGYAQFDAQFLLVFIKNISSLYLGNVITLNNGKEGKVILVNDNSPSRPIIMCFDGEIIDLTHTPELYVEYMKNSIELPPDQASENAG